MHVCAEPGCPELVERGVPRCPDHTFDRLSGSAGVRHRRAVLRRDPVCKRCGLEMSTEADHVVPLEHGGSNAMSNMQGLCTRCHVEKGREDRGSATP